MKSILSIDPGVSTGIAIRLKNNTYVTCTVKGNTEVWEFIDNDIDIVLCESFQAQTISRFGLHTVRLVGSVQALCHDAGIPLYMQHPQFRRHQLTRARYHLRKIPYTTRHEVDALAHLFAWEYENEKIAHPERD